MTRTPARPEWVDALRPAIDAGVIAYAQRAQAPPEDPLLVAAIGLRETWLGHMPGYRPLGSPDGTGDHGHGRGYWQIDDRGPFKHLIRPAPWAPEVQVEAACEVLGDARRELRAHADSPKFLLAVVCAYNAGTARVGHLMVQGADPNRATFAGDYGDDVLRIYDALRTGAASALYLKVNPFFGG